MKSATTNNEMRNVAHLAIGPDGSPLAGSELEGFLKDDRTIAAYWPVLKRSAEDLKELGQALARQKLRLGHGNFLKYLAQYGPQLPFGSP